MCSYINLTSSHFQSFIYLIYTSAENNQGTENKDDQQNQDDKQNQLQQQQQQPGGAESNPNGNQRRQNLNRRQRNKQNNGEASGTEQTHDAYVFRSSKSLLSQV